MRTLILSAALLICSLAALSQSHSLHLNANYLLTQKPVFGFGYAFAPDSSRLTFGTSFEFGRFSYVETGILATEIDKYEESGIGFRPEMRWYAGANGLQQTGVFVSGFVNLRLFYANHLQGEVNEAGLLEYPVVESHAERQVRVGGQLGYRVECGAQGIYVEGAIGGGTNLGRGSAAQPFFQLDLNLVGFIRSASRAQEEDYVTLPN